MHEVALALGMVDELIRIADKNNAKNILTVNLKIGKMSGIVTDSLKFAFDAVKLEHPILISTAIRIEEVPLVYECIDCGRTFSPRDESDAAYTPEDHVFPSCRDCNSYNLKILSGEEMDISNLEVEV
ncbi:MAG TPA: hydrogenase maturation nickel metallochaperone HypA [Nitrospirae bacterium]|nr:hydrogenase maturation nickel metallochaperone HypA [Nitrospirota bacterium]